MNDTRQRLKGLIEAMKEQGDVIFGEILPMVNELEALRQTQQQAGDAQAVLSAAQNAAKEAQQRLLALEKEQATWQRESEMLHAEVNRLQDELKTAAAAPAPALSAPAAAGGVATADVARQFAELQFQVETLDYAPGQVDIIKATLDGALQFATRGALFIVKGAQAIAWSGTGFESDIRNRTITLGGNNGFSRALSTLHWQHGTGDSENTLTGFTRIAPKHWAVFPVLVRGKVAALLYADDGGGDAPFMAAPLLLLTRVAGLAIDGLKDREKRQPIAPEKVFAVLGGNLPQPAASHAPAEPLLSMELTPAPEPPPPPVVAAPPPPPPPVVAAPPPPPPPPVVVAPPPVPVIVPEPPPPPAPVRAPEPAPAPAPPPAAAPSAGDIPPEEKRLHDDARRYARVLAQEILLYNAQRVETGRKKNNIYSVLKDEIDKSREAYDRRFKQPQIQSRPYFHDALVQYLCEGNPGSLGL